MSTSADPHLEIVAGLGPLAVVALATAALASLIALYYLVRRPRLTTAVKLGLLAGLGALPILTAGTGNYAGFEASTTRPFCGGCHVMKPWVDDAADPRSTTLAARHSRNHLFGDRSCYTCHADYGMFGTVATKINGLHHVAAYYREYADTPIDEALRTIRIYRPFQSATCTHCHSTELPGWRAVADHRVFAEPGRGDTSCVSTGCHGPAHPFSKIARGELVGGTP